MFSLCSILEFLSHNLYLLDSSISEEHLGIDLFTSGLLALNFLPQLLVHHESMFISLADIDHTGRVLAKLFQTNKVVAVVVRTIIVWVFDIDTLPDTLTSAAFLAIVEKEQSLLNHLLVGWRYLFGFGFGFRVLG